MVTCTQREPYLGLEQVGGVGILMESAVDVEERYLGIDVGRGVNVEVGGVLEQPIL